MFELTIVKSLNKAYRQVSIGKLSFGTFKQQCYMNKSSQLIPKKSSKGI